MKTVTGRVISAEPISLSKAATLLSGFASSENGASQDVSAYVRRASAAFTELKSFHREIKSKETKPSSDARRERNVTDGFDSGDIRDRKREAMSEETVYGREEEDKKKKKKKDDDVIDEKVKEKLEDKERSEERKEKKKKKKIKSEEETGSGEGKSKKKRKSDEELGSEKRKGKKKRKS